MRTNPIKNLTVVASNVDDGTLRPIVAILLLIASGALCAIGVAVLLDRVWWLGAIIVIVIAVMAYRFATKAGAA